MIGENGVLVQSVLRALDILLMFQEAESLGVSEIAREMKISKSTAFALINTLAERGFLEQSPVTKKYRLGIRNFELGRYMRQRMDLRSEATPIVMDLLGKYQATIHLTVHYKGEVVYLESYRVPDVNILYTQTGKRAPMHCSSVGKAMLAFLPSEYLDQYVLNKPLIAMTPYTITDVQTLLAELALVRRQGYALDDEEIEEGLKCIGAPIFDFSQSVVAAVSICGPLHRMTDERRNEMIPDIIKCSKLISYRMGYKEQF